MDNIVYKDNKPYYKKNCPHCNQEFLFHMEDGERRVHGACKSCGKTFEMIVPGIEKQCASCGCKLLDIDKFCPNCGFPVEKPKEAPIEKKEENNSNPEKKNYALTGKLTEEEKQVFNKYLRIPAIVFASSIILTPLSFLAGPLIIFSIGFVISIVAGIMFLVQKKYVLQYENIMKQVKAFIIMCFVYAVLCLGFMIWGIIIVAS